MEYEATEKEMPAHLAGQGAPRMSTEYCNPVRSTKKDNDCLGAFTTEKMATLCRFVCL